MRTLVLGACLALVAACEYDRSVLYGDAAASVTPERAAAEYFGTECSDCVAETCAAEVEACAHDDECAAEVLCRHACDDPACYVDCENTYPPYARPARALELCAIDNMVGCGNECPVGRDFSCVGGYEWPNPEAVAVTMRLQFQDFAAGTLLEEDVRVRVCRDRSDPSCAMPAFEHRSDVLGQVEVTLPSQGGDNRGYLPFEGFLVFDDPGHAPERVVPTMLFFGLSYARSSAYPIDTLVFTPSFPPALFGQEGGMGMVAGVVFDCRMLSGQEQYSARAKGVTFAVDNAPNATLFYPSGGTGTGGDGFFVIPNVPAGMTTLTGSDGDQTVARIDLPVVADTVSYVWLTPLAAEP